MSDWHSDDDYDPLYHHVFVSGLTFITETPKAYQVEYKGRVLWVPKSICKEVEGSTAYIHRDTWYRILH